MLFSEMTSVYTSLPFILLIILCFIKGYKNTSKSYREECVGLGVLGTFIGITISLINFDSNNISQSIPLFIDGIKIAFISSASGLLASIILSLQSSNADDGMQRLIELNKTNNEILSASMNNLTANTSYELIQALRIVVDDFNTNVEKQFGDNFRKLNNSVDDMLKWQKEYKDLITNQQSVINKQFKVMSNRLKDFDEYESQSIYKMDTYFKKMNSQFDTHMKSMTTQYNKIQELNANIEKSSLQTLNDLETSVISTNNHIEKSVNLAQENITTLIGIANGKIR